MLSLGPLLILSMLVTVVAVLYVFLFLPLALWLLDVVDIRSMEIGLGQIGIVRPLQGEGSGDMPTQGGAPRLRRCGVPWADILRPRWGKDRTQAESRFRLECGRGSDRRRYE